MEWPKKRLVIMCLECVNECVCVCVCECGCVGGRVVGWVGKQGSEL